MPLELNYHHLFYFWTCVRAGRVTAAARELSLSQSALSLQLKSLERSLQRRLLTRTRSGVELTPEGRVVFGHCERIFSAGAALAQDLRGTRVGPVPVRLGVAAALGRDVVMAALSALSEDPGTIASVYVGPQEDLRERLLRRRLDLVVAGADFSPELGHPFRSSLVHTLPVVFASAPALSKRLSGFPRRGMEVPVLLRAREHPLRERVLAWLRGRGARPVTIAETEDADLLEALAVQGRGVAALPSTAARAAAAAGRLKLLARATGLGQEVWVNWPDTGADGSVRRFLDRLPSLRARLRSGRS